MMNNFELPKWPGTNDGTESATLKFDYRQSAEDFVVIEDLGFKASGDGEHTLLFIEKKNLTTLQVREYLAQRFKLPAMHIGYSGLKDKLAITRQWFSLSRSIEIEVNKILELGKGSFTVLKAIPHYRKLKIGTHKSNHFKLVLRNLELASSTNSKEISDHLIQKVDHIKKSGFPNYFGPQRFGHSGGNIDKALHWFSTNKKISKEKQSLYLSSARSLIFNELLAVRVRSKSWNLYKPEDKLILSGSQSYFSIDLENQSELDDVKNRLKEGDIAIAGPMLGKAEDLTTSEKAAIDHSENRELLLQLIKGLENQKAKTHYRPFSLRPSEFSFTANDKEEPPSIEINFNLTKGAFATALLKEMGHAR